jgi:hypothetical protein
MFELSYRIILYLNRKTSSSFFSETDASTNVVKLIFVLLPISSDELECLTLTSTFVLI